MTVIFSVFRWGKKRFPDYNILPYLFFIVMWLAWEHIYFNVEISWPWLVLGNSFATSVKLVQWYEIFGTVGGSLWILLTNVLIYFTVLSLCNDYSKRSVKWFFSISAFLLIAVPVVCSLVRYNNYKETEPGIEVVVVQPNIDPFKKYGILPQEELDRNMLEQVGGIITPDTKYIITPETFTYGLDLDNPTGSASFLRYRDFLSKYPEVNLLVGVLTYKYYPTYSKPTSSARPNGKFWYDVYNTALMMDYDGRFEYYHKSKLVPGVEIIPYQQYVPFLADLISKFGGADNSYGTQEDMSILEGNDGNKVGAMICYESIYGDYSRRAAKMGATFMAVMTNDGWWGDTPGYRQHFRYASLRAIEMRRDVVHATNTGISGFINQRGDASQKTPWWEAVAIRGEVHPNSVITPFTKYGDVVGLTAAYAFLPLLILFFMHGFLEKSRKKRS